MDIQVRGREPTSMREAAAPKASVGSKLSPDRVKMIVAGALLFLAAIALAWQFGAFSGGNKYKNSDTTPLGVSQEEADQMWKEAERERDRVHPPAVTPPPSGS